MGACVQRKMVVARGGFRLLGGGISPAFPMVFAAVVWPVFN